MAPATPPNEAAPLRSDAAQGDNEPSDTTLTMDMNSASVKPSVERSRLAETLTASAGAEGAREFNIRRGSFATVGESPVAPSSTGKPTGKRTSILTELFARSSTSASFHEQTIRPTVIISLMKLKEKHPDIDVLRDVLGERLLQIPRFSSTFRLQNDKVYCDAIPSADVDLEYHIRSIDGRNTFGPDDVGEMISAASHEWWDASRPLWRLTLITDMADGRSLLFCTIDHALGDGVAMLSVLRLLLDDPPEGTQGFQHKRPVPPSVKWPTKLVWLVYGIYDGILGWMIKPTDPENGLKIPLDKSIGDAGSKTFTETRRYPLSAIKKMKSKLVGSSVNDVIMAAITIGIRHYLARTEDPILGDIDGKKGTKLQAMSLVNLRSPSSKPQVHNTGNDFATVNFELPLHFETEIDAVWKIKRLMDYYKVSPCLTLMKSVGLRLLAVLPESALIQATMETIRKPSCIMSNVMGPSFECSVAGYAVDDISFLASSAIGLYIGIISYNGQVSISFATDNLAEIDCTLLKECLEGAMHDLEKAISEDPAKQIEQPDVTPTAAKIIECGALPFCVAAAAMAVSCLVVSARNK